MYIYIYGCMCVYLTAFFQSRRSQLHALVSEFFFSGIGVWSGNLLSFLLRCGMKPHV